MCGEGHKSDETPQINSWQSCTFIVLKIWQQYYRSRFHLFFLCLPTQMAFCLNSGLIELLMCFVCLCMCA